MNEWTRFDDQFPEETAYVRCYRQCGEYCQWTGREAIAFLQIYDDITHWQLITMPPQ